MADRQIPRLIMATEAASVVGDLLPGSHVLKVERIEPWFVYRVWIDGPTSSVIVKRLRDDPQGFRVDPSQVATEIAALRFVKRVGLDIAPRVLASDESRNVLVLEDLHPRVPLPDVLIDGDPRVAQERLVEFAEALGSLNAATAGRSSEFEAPSTESPEDLELERWRETLQSAEALGVAVPTSVMADVEAMFGELSEPGPFSAMSNGDAGTNNFLVAPDLPGKLIDFEFARFRHALLDAVNFYVQGPQWVTLPDAGPLEDAYRRRLASGIPEAEADDQFGMGLTAACLSYVLLRLHRLEKLDLRDSSDLSRLQLVATLESGARVAEDRGYLRALGGWCADVAAALRRRWPDTDVDLRSLPPFLARDERSLQVIDRERKATDGA